MNTTEFKRPVTIQDAIKEIERELSVRRRVYPDWVRMGKIKQAVANDRITALEHAVLLLKKIASPEQTTLF